MNATTLIEAIRNRLGSSVKPLPLVLKPILTLSPDQTRIIRPRGLMALFSILVSAMPLTAVQSSAQDSSPLSHEPSASATAPEKASPSC